MTPTPRSSSPGGPGARARITASRSRSAVPACPFAGCCRSPGSRASRSPSTPAAVITCRIEVDGVVATERTNTGAFAVVSCHAP
ncbi:MmpS family transport accessory protein [Tersicoccus solisilvae]|uniref:MmpS family transport accessory protein n=1 Tax=Tersicoccus solisilvae TaxID=1882339 RepID=UPI001665CEBB